MDHIVYISKEITDNDDGVVDDIVSSIHAAPKGSRLVALITCIGGNTYQGDRIYHAIESHDGSTYGLVIGAAISMAASLAPAFDVFEIDEGAEFMLHSAKPSNGERSKETDLLIKRFNEKTKSRFQQKGVDINFLNSVFDDGKDHWLTPDEVQAYGIGKKVKVNRSQHKGQFALAAKLESKISKMGIFKTKALRTVELLNGGSAVFESKKEELAVGDTLRLIGEGSLSNSIELKGGIKATLSNDGEVEAIEDMEPVTDYVTKEEFDALSAKVVEIERMISEAAGKKDTEAVENAEKEEEIMDKVGEAVALANQAIENAVLVAKGLKSSFELPKLDEKKEVKTVAKLDDSVSRLQELKTKLNEIE